jgi:hypothetical protein
MAGATRPVFLVALLTGLGIVLWATFSSSEHTLTLALGGLFATGMGLMLLMRPGQASNRPSSTAGIHHSGETGPSLLMEGNEDLPDPLDHQLDMPI